MKTNLTNGKIFFLMAILYAFTLTLFLNSKSKAQPHTGQTADYTVRCG